MAGKNARILFGVLLVATFGLLAPTARATPINVTVPFSDNFDSYTTGIYGSSTVNGTWYSASQATTGTGWQIGTTGAVSGKGFEDSGTSSGGPKGMTASVDVGSSLPANANFTVSDYVTVNITPTGGGRTDFGLGALGTTSDLLTGDAVLCDFGFSSVGNPGTLRIVGIGTTDAAAFSLVYSTPTLPFKSGDQYEQTVTGTYSGGLLTMQYTVQDLTPADAGSLTLSETATGAIASGGDYFGPRDNVSGSGNADFTHDNFALTPEPATVALLGLGAPLLLLRQRRSQPQPSKL